MIKVHPMRHRRISFRRKKKAKKTEGRRISYLDFLSRGKKKGGGRARGGVICGVETEKNNCQFRKKGCSRGSFIFGKMIEPLKNKKKRY